ncbi:VWA domain-containing protein [Candidatus Poribacteria bacterium]|nr:VWA domain-containing protein [Candidatus Poribacteria bacterium]MYB64220.1 VWA domain-containing protein [Candidatus Poribacteria bacterium]MYF55558.1 VWA domain-containing protein [Candidatus Poribacteria bacterium]MYI92938.1 VWA domain-containing protein [Candidatus Poribacteria bacterium]
MKLSIVASILLLSAFLIVNVCIAENGVHTDNIVVILDASGSMKDKFRGDETKSKMDAAKEALQEVLAKIPDGTNIGVLVFSGRNVPNEWVYPLGPKDTNKLIEAINRPEPEGGTPLGRYIRIGANRLLEQRDKQYNYGNYRLLIVTDGEAQDSEKVAKYTPEILNRHLRVDVIGVDMSTDHQLAQEADSYRRADNPGELVAAVSQILAETGGTATDVGGEEAFDDIAPLTTEIASDLIKRITTPASNEAIAIETTSTVPRQPNTPTQPQQPTQQPVQQRDRGGNAPWILIGIVVLVAGYIIFRRMGRH